MTAPSKTPLSLRTPGASQASSKARTQFNTLIERLEAQRTRLAAWHDALPRMRARADAELKPLEEQMRMRLRELVLLFDQAYEHKSLKKKEREKLSFLIAEVSFDLIGKVDDDEMEALHAKHGLSDEDSEDDPTMDEMKALFADVFGLPQEDEPDAPELNSHSRVGSDESEHLERKPTPKETRKAVEENRLQQSVREIFRKLASILHPDRESDPVERERKTALMQRANVAYAAQDLLGLLELQFEVEQIDQSALELLDDARIKQYNKVLTKQVAEVRGEIEDLEHWLIYDLGISTRGRITPAALDKVLASQIREMKLDIVDVERDLAQFQDLALLKKYLKNFTIPRGPTFYAEDYF